MLLKGKGIQEESFHQLDKVQLFLADYCVGVFWSQRLRIRRRFKIVSEKKIQLGLGNSQPPMSKSLKFLLVYLDVVFLTASFFPVYGVNIQTYTLVKSIARAEVALGSCSEGR